MTKLDPGAKYTVAASSLAGLLAYARAARIDTSGALAAAGLNEKSLQGPEARVSHAANNVVWQHVSEASGDPAFGLHFAERLDLGTFDVVGQLMVRCRTFGDALERAVAYSRILHDAGRIERERVGSDVLIYPGCRGLPFECPRQIAEFSAASVLVLGRLITGKELKPEEVRFQHPKPKQLSEHVRLFGVEPSFSEPETVVVLDARVLELAVRDPQPGVLTDLDAFAKDVISKLPQDDDVLDRIERLIANTLSSGLVEMEQVATQLGMSARTLQRRLGERETSYQALVDGVRRAYAERYLADDKLALGEVAFLLGFTDPSNFHRAFRRWTGMTPSAYRDAQRGGRGAS